MKNVSRILPLYTADTSGVCSALYELGGMTVVHDASGCNSTYTTHDEPRWYDMRSKIYISALTELDAVMGNDEKLISDIVSCAADQEPEFIAVCGSPMPMMTGVDFDAIAAEVADRSGIRTIPLHTNGTRSYIEGASEAFLEIVKAYARECHRTERLGVNVFGATPLDLPLGSDQSLRRWLEENGMELVCCLAMGSSLEDVRRAPSARVDLVVSQSGMAAAEYMKEKYGIPYVCGVPFGKGFAKHLAGHIRSAACDTSGSCPPFVLPCDGFDDADTVVIGESISAGSLTAALWFDMKIAAKPVCTLESHRFFCRRAGGVISAEEDLEAYLSGHKPGTVIADPLYRYIVPRDVKFIPLPHFAFSGRCFQRDMRDLINTEIKEYFK
ncbi:MAG: oxalate:formate antiporter [Ruminococcus sp.]|nr:oxalate:formate antiporter [Ruminococcus sp.]